MVERIIVVREKSLPRNDLDVKNAVVTEHFFGDFPACQPGMERLSVEELAARSGSSVDRIRRLAGVGLLEPDDDGSFAMAAINRVRLADALDREGVPLEDMGEAKASGQLSFEFVDHLFLDAVPLRDQTIDVPS